MIIIFKLGFHLLFSVTAVSSMPTDTETSKSLYHAPVFPPGMLARATNLNQRKSKIPYNLWIAVVNATEARLHLRFFPTLLCTLSFTFLAGRGRT